MSTELEFFFISVEVQEAEWTEKNKVMQGTSSSGTAGINISPRKNTRGEGGASRRSCDNSVSEDQSATLPLLHLVRQLLRNASTQTLMRLQASIKVESLILSPSSSSSSSSSLIYMMFPGHCTRQHVHDIIWRVSGR